jgi:hypothetical protein
MELSATREAAICAVTREIPNTSWKPKVNYRKRSPLVHTLSQTNPVNIPPSFLSKIHLMEFFLQEISA